MGRMAIYSLETEFLLDLHDREGGGDVLVEGMRFLVKCHASRDVGVIVQDETGVHMIPVKAGGRVWVRNVANADVLVISSEDDARPMLDMLRKLEEDVLGSDRPEDALDVAGDNALPF